MTTATITSLDPFLTRLSLVSRAPPARLLLLFLQALSILLRILIAAKLLRYLPKFLELVRYLVSRSNKEKNDACEAGSVIEVWAFGDESLLRQQIEATPLLSEECKQVLCRVAKSGLTKSEKPGHGLEAISGTLKSCCEYESIDPGDKTGVEETHGNPDSYAIQTSYAFETGDESFLEPETTFVDEDRYEKLMGLVSPPRITHRHLGRSRSNTAPIIWNRRACSGVTSGFLEVPSSISHTSTDPDKTLALDAYDEGKKEIHPPTLQIEDKFDTKVNKPTVNVDTAVRIESTPLVLDEAPNIRQTIGENIFAPTINAEEEIEEGKKCPRFDAEGGILSSLADCDAESVASNITDYYAIPNTEFDGRGGSSTDDEDSFNKETPRFRVAKPQKALEEKVRKAQALFDAAMAKQRETRELKFAACRAFFKAHNRLYNPTMRTGLTRLDLHGQRVNAALRILDLHLTSCLKKGVQQTSIVTGRGLHSHNGIPRLKPAILAALSSRPELSIHMENPGCINVTWKQQSSAGKSSSQNV